jgi:hypothetical protein
MDRERERERESGRSGERVAVVSAGGDGWAAIFLFHSSLLCFCCSSFLFLFFFGLWVYGLKVVLGWFAKNEDGDDVLYFVVLLLLLFGFDLVLIMVK